MFDWLDGRAPQLLSARDLDAWPGGVDAPKDVARIGASDHSALLHLSGDGPAAAIPLELGGMLLVTSIRCGSEDALSAHLDLLPVTGWTMLPDRFEARGGDFALFDGALPGKDLARRRARWILVSLTPGSYEVETFARWQPDPGTLVHLVRLIRAAP